MNSWKDNLGKLCVEFEISTQCNSFCPQCMRYEQGTENLHPNTTNSKWNLEEFKESFDAETLKAIKHFHLSGTKGDPCTCNDLPEIVEYIVSVSPETQVHIATNGSLQTEEWWWDLCVKGKENLSVIFAVDGTTQEMHSKYRRNTNLEKILRNMEVVSNTKARIEVFTVVFKHNQDHVNEIFEMCKEFGASHHDTVESGRFKSNEPFKFVDKNGVEDQLEQATISYDNETRLLRDYRHEIKQTGIKCKWNRDRKLLILNDGKVYPCCYTSWPIQQSTRLFTGKMSYLNNAESIRDKKLVDILNNDFFAKGLFESFEEPDYTCKRWCSK